MTPKIDKELESYRQLMTAPGTFEEGFSWASVVGAVFVGLLMVPGSMYMSLLAGSGIGPAAQWVTVLLFMEIAKRAHKNLRKAQIFTLFYMAGAVMATPFQGLLYSQFFVQSSAVVGQGMAEMIPHWYAPRDPRVLAERNFFQAAWIPAIAVVVFSEIMSRINNSILSFGLFKLTSDIEKLPFPMAPVGAQGITAIAEDQDDSVVKKEGWRWRVFSIGGALGLTFGFLYLGLPTLSSAILGKTILLFPIPFADWTGRTEGFLPAVATGISFDFGNVVLGMVMPFWAVVGSVSGQLFTWILNPLLYHYNVLTSWVPGDSSVETFFKGTLDFYFSYGLGISLAVAAVGIFPVFKAIKSLRAIQGSANAIVIPKGRGDIPAIAIGIVYLVSMCLYIVVCGMLIHWHLGVMTFLVIYGLIYTPLISYATARLEGMVGMELNIPLIREAGMILSGYQGIACWFLPFPMLNYGVHTVFYRQAELTGTKFTSIWKTEIILVPFIILCSILFAQFIWSLAPIPSSNYPFADTIWDLNARNQTLLYSSTSGGYSQFREAFRPLFIGFGFGTGLLVFSALKILSAPTMLAYGFVMGINTMMHVMPMQLFGALFGRFYLERKIGSKWRQYAAVISAGFFCGAGLIATFCIGVNFLTQSVFKMPF